MNARVHWHSIRERIAKFCVLLSPFYCICELFRVRIKVDLMKCNVEMVDYSLQLYELVEQPFIVFSHDTFLTTNNDFDSRLRTSMEFSETEKKYRLSAIFES
jgi:hypothetical protein